jgi:hypothetical protein
MTSLMNPPLKSIRAVVQTRLLQFTVASALALAPGAWATTFSDDFNDGNDTTPAWQHYDPISLATGGAVSLGAWSLPGGNTYRIQTAASPDPGTFGQARVGSIASVNLSSFYIAVDVLNYDDTTHQVLGILARAGDLGPGTTTGYLFSWDTGGSPTGGDMDIVRIEGEVPHDLDNTYRFGEDGIHLEPNHGYRFVFMGVDGTFRGQVYDLTNTAVPLVDYGVTDPNYDPNGTSFVSGPAGLLVANNAGPFYDGPADATFDNFLATDGPLLNAGFPLLTITRPSPDSVKITWPGVGNGASGNRVLTDSLYSSPSLTAPVWTQVTSGITQDGVENVYVVSPAANSQFFKLILP